MTQEKIFNISDFEQIGINMFALGNICYRLYAKGATPNGCWLIGAVMRSFDISIATGKISNTGHDITLGNGIGTVSANGISYITYR